MVICLKTLTERMIVNLLLEVSLTKLLRELDSMILITMVGGRQTTRASLKAKIIPMRR
jgi:hypothetical protein